MEKPQKKIAVEINAAEEATKEIEKEVKPKLVEKKQPKAPEKQYYSVVVEATVPTTLTYRVLAETPEQALELIKNAPLVATPKLRLQGARKHKANVYISGTSMIKLTKMF